MPSEKYRKDSRSIFSEGLVGQFEYTVNHVLKACLHVAFASVYASNVKNGVHDSL